MTDEENYIAAVQGRREFRAAYRKELEHRRALVKITASLLEAMNPTDRGGISLHEWNGRMKAATANAKAELDEMGLASPTEPTQRDNAPEGTRQRQDS